MFARFAIKMTTFAGSGTAFLCAVLIVVSWLVSGFFFSWSESHALFINTLTTVITFLMVFIIQHGQNKDTAAIHKKLDELVKATEGARDSLAGIEDKSIETIKDL